LELLLPVAFVGILVSIRNAVVKDDDAASASRIVNATIPDDFYAFTPLSFQDYATALNAQRKCTKQPSGSFTFDPETGFSNASAELGWGITGMALQGANWQVPMIKCDPGACQIERQDAINMCEFSILAVSAANGVGLDRAYDFAAWVYDFYYPLLNQTASSTTTTTTSNNKTNSSSSSPLPDFDLVQIFDSSQQIDEYVKSENYGTTGYPKIAMAILWNANMSSTNDYSFTLRQNSTNFNNPKEAARPGVATTPDTNRLFDHYARNDFSVCVSDDGPSQGALDKSCTGQYVYNGILTFQRLAGDYILNRTGTATRFPVATSGGVTFVQFPTLPYEENGFYANIANFAPLFVVLGLLYPVASMVAYVAKEKELRQKELMKMMSVTETDMYV
jgi:ABC-2 family transporter protein